MLAFFSEAAGISQPVRLSSHEMTQMFSPRFHAGVDLGLPIASLGLASLTRRAFACATMPVDDPDAEPAPATASAAMAIESAARILTC